MDVSVIFATHNREDVLGKVFEAWRKVDAETKYKYEIICSDDESTDRTIDIIKDNMRDLPIRLIQNKKGGAGKARNAALQVATGEIIIFTGDDIFPQENFVNAHYENYLKYGPDVATLGRIDWHPEIRLNHLMKHITEIGCEQFGFIALPAYQMIDFRHFYTSNISVSRKMLNSLEYYFDTDFDKYGFEDIELGYRLQKNGMKMYYDPDILIYHHHVYNNVQKFSMRQMSAGEELVVFSHMHDDLEDKCICDVDNCRKSFYKYKEKHSGQASLRGRLLLWCMALGEKISVACEKRIDKKHNSKCRALCSLIYVAIFRVYFFYGVALRIAQEEKIASDTSQIMDFAYQYMKSPIHELYWDIGFGMNENDARKWRCCDTDRKVLTKALPQGVKEIRLSPLKDYCIARVDKIAFILKNGTRVPAEIYWHNACDVSEKKYDFSHTNDSCIYIKEIPKDYDRIEIEMRVKHLKKNSFLRMLRNIAAKMYHKAQYKRKNSQKVDFKYAYGQRRRIQIGISGEFIGERKEELIQQYREQVAILGEDVIVSDADFMERGYINYIYSPKEQPLDITQFLQVAYMLLDHVVDYVLVSKSYVEFPRIACKQLEDVLIYQQLLERDPDFQWLGTAKGRYMRLPAYKQEKDTIDIQQICSAIRLKESYFLNASKLEFRMSERVFGKHEGGRPLIFVVPIFFAVGGVERNTVEIMRQLKDKYDFCLITLESHSEQQGSLHYQLEGICKYIFDIREITEQDNFLACLYELKQMFQPQVFWLCNNSPWFEYHTAQIRQIFSDVAIVAQDVYDTKMGWIEYYKNAEVKTFDRYIAITELIRETFINEYQISDQKIDVIYPAIDDQSIKRVKEQDISYEQICDKYGLDKNKKHFSFVARLAKQKNPLRYLNLVKTAIEQYEEEMEFVMVGDGDYRNQVNEFIERNGLISKIVQIPYVANAPELIKIMDGLIVTSNFEGMPIVCIEAMCMGTPILSTDSGDTRRFVEKNGCGLIINDEKSDIENFTEFLLNLDSYKAAAKEHAEEVLYFFSANAIALKYQETFENALKNSRKEED